MYEIRAYYNQALREGQSSLSWVSHSTLIDTSGFVACDLQILLVFYEHPAWFISYKRYKFVSIA